jgi:hypothetical protein
MTPETKDRIVRAGIAGVSLAIGLVGGHQINQSGAPVASFPTTIKCVIEQPVKVDLKHRLEVVPLEKK